MDAHRKDVGIASWYGAGFDGRITANGERYAMADLTAAHRTLPFGTILLITNLENGRQVQVRINDRGPYVRGRILDVSHAAAQELEMLQRGTTRILFTIAQRKGEADLSARVIADDAVPQVVPLAVLFNEAEGATWRTLPVAPIRYTRQEGPRFGSLGDVWHNRRTRRHDSSLESTRLI